MFFENPDFGGGVSLCRRRVRTTGEKDSPYPLHLIRYHLPCIMFGHDKPTGAIEQEILRNAAANGMREEKQFSSKHRYKKIAIITGSVVVLLGAVGAALFLYPFKSSAQIIQDALRSLQSEKKFQTHTELSVEYDVSVKTLSLNAQASGTQQLKGKIGYDQQSQVDLTDAKTPKSRNTVQLKYESGGTSYKGSAELISIDKSLFLKLIEMPTILFFSFDPYTGQWFKYPDATNLDALKNISTFGLPTDKEQYKDLIQKVKARKVDFLKIASMGKTLERGRLASQYRATVDKDKLKTYISDVIDIVISGDKTLNGGKTLGSVSVDKQGMLKFVDGLQNVYIDFVIDTFQSLPLRMGGEATYKLLAEKEGDASGTVRFSFTAGYDYQKSIIIEAPKDAKEFPKSISPLGGSLSRPISGDKTELQQQPVLGKDSDQDGLSDDLEKVYATDPLKSDSDGDGYLDGPEVFGGYNPLGAGKLLQE